jgi:hypothetical protein
MIARWRTEKTRGDVLRVPGMVLLETVVGTRGTTLCCTGNVLRGGVAEFVLVVVYLFFDGAR